jgi:hypothetical protein
MALLASAAGAAETAVPAAIPTMLSIESLTPLELVSRDDAHDADVARNAIDAEVAPAALALSGAGARKADSPPAARPGKRKALLYSLLLPGAGELSLGAKGRAAGFFVAEGLIWTHYVWFQVAGHLRRDDYIEQAQLNAGVGINDASDDYWRIVGQYERSSGAGPGSYEEEIRREGREIHPDDPAAQDAYVAENLPSGDRAWSWDDANLRAAYRATRANANRAFDRAKYSFAAAIFNRLLSAVDTQILHRRLARDEQANLDQGTRLLADALPGGGARVVLFRRF